MKGEIIVLNILSKSIIYHISTIGNKRREKSLKASTSYVKRTIEEERHMTSINILTSHVELLSFKTWTFELNLI